MDWSPSVVPQLGSLVRRSTVSQLVGAQGIPWVLGSINRFLERSFA